MHFKDKLHTRSCARVQGMAVATVVQFVRNKFMRARTRDGIEAADEDSMRRQSLTDTATSSVSDTSSVHTVGARSDRTTHTYASIQDRGVSVSIKCLY
jgi:hypothetical protein